MLWLLIKIKFAFAIFQQCVTVRLIVLLAPKQFPILFLYPDIIDLHHKTQTGSICLPVSLKKLCFGQSFKNTTTIKVKHPFNSYSQFIDVEGENEMSSSIQKKSKQMKCLQTDLPAIFFMLIYLGAKLFQKWRV